MKSSEYEFVFTPKTYKDRDIEILVTNIESHRNGVSGEPFFVLTFTDPELPNQKFVGIVFQGLLKQDKDGYHTNGLVHKSFSDEGWTNPEVAVFDIGMLNEGNIGRANMWRGDHYLPVFVVAITDREKQMKKHDERMYKKDAKTVRGY